MKIDKIKSLKNKLVTLKLIETRTYLKTSKSSLKIVDIASRLKKSLHIIYKYHNNNKRILFVGTPMNFNKNLQNIFKNTKHILLPQSIWINGILTNSNVLKLYLSKNKTSINSKFSEMLLKLYKKPDLIVILKSSFKEKILNEGNLANIPIIFLGYPLNISDLRVSYKLPGNFKFAKKKIRDNLFYFILTAIFKKVNKVRIKVNPKSNHTWIKSTPSNKLKKNNTIYF